MAVLELGSPPPRAGQGRQLGAPVERTAPSCRRRHPDRAKVTCSKGRKEEGEVGRVDPGEERGEGHTCDTLVMDPSSSGLAVAGSG